LLLCHLIRLIENVTTVVTDESVLEYQPTNDVKQKAQVMGEPIPVVFIPRKPHPNGLECFLTCSYISHPIKKDKVLPFVVDILPHLKMGDLSPTGAVQQTMARY
jgi:hypothetical protein